MAPSPHELFQYSSHSGTWQQICRVRQWETQATVYPWLSCAISNKQCFGKIFSCCMIWPLNNSAPYPLSTMKVKHFPTWKENGREISTLLLTVFLYESLFSLINGLDSLCVLIHIIHTFLTWKKYAFILSFADLLWAGPFQYFKIKTMTSYTGIIHQVLGMLYHTIQIIEKTLPLQSKIKTFSKGKFCTAATNSLLYQLRETSRKFYFGSAFCP